jgi:hypothetical protein
MTKKQMEGSGIKDILKGVNKFLRKHKVISKGASIAAKVGPKKYRKGARATAGIAKQLGYGKGGALRLAGQRGPRGRGPGTRRRKIVGRPRKKK